jgi:hypothetical protein
LLRGLELHIRQDTPSGWWYTDSSHPAFRALKKGFGRDGVAIGCGGSIPFVEPFAKALGGVPALRAAIHLYEELAQTLGKS